MFRKILFWSHLVCGISAGLVILMMSLTGVLLAFERQILAWAEQRDYVPLEAQQDRLSLEQLHFIASTGHGELSPTAVTVTRDAGAPVTFATGRQGISLNPYSGETMTVGSPALERFFSTTTGIHRWFNLDGDNRDKARAITGASNLMFLFLILSGMYLWFPRLWSGAMFRVRLLLRDSAGDSRARDFNWHHVLGIWSAIPLVFIVATASVFYYPWANSLVYRVYGEEVPTRGRGPGPAAETDNNSMAMGSLPAGSLSYPDLDTLFSHASDYIANNIGNWRQITMTLPAAHSPTASFAIDFGNGGQPQLRHTLVLDRTTGTVSEWQPFSSQSPGRRTRSVIRFLHTGEVFGIWGQFIATLVSLTSLFMVWTGLALAWRRLVSPMLRP